MVYLCIKEMAKISEDVIIVTSSLTKDMTGKEDQFRAPSIRALCRITDVSRTTVLFNLMIHSLLKFACMSKPFHTPKCWCSLALDWTRELILLSLFVSPANSPFHDLAFVLLTGNYAAEH